MNADAQHGEPLGIVVVGASGDLAQHKIIPALFALFCQGYLPADFRVYGLARTAYDHESFRAKIAENLTCRYVPGESCGDKTNAFLQRCFYCQGQYASRDSFLDLFQIMKAEEGNRPVNRLFYMAIPPSVFQSVAKALGDSGMVVCGNGPAWSRLVVEKPFGSDRASSDALVQEMQNVFREEQTYRIDHYLGKEIVQNLMVLRFANLVFEPVWNARYIHSVSIRWSEEIGVGDRGGYFNDYGIIRDVMQNHLLQILSLLAMERPVELCAAAVRDAKVAVLKRVRPIDPADLVVGQYGASVSGARPGYRAESGVPADSRTPTYAAAVLHLDTPRWAGVPFFIEAGKALPSRLNEVRIRFREVPGGTFCGTGPALPPNELVIRIQPDEAIALRIMNKAPGLGMELVPSELNLRYKSAFPVVIPDAYECLLLDVIQGDRNLFIRADELAAAWDVFTPVLQALDRHRVEPEPYAAGGPGPEAGRALARRYGIPEV